MNSAIIYGSYILCCLYTLLACFAGLEIIKAQTTSSPLCIARYCSTMLKGFIRLMIYLSFFSMHTVQKKVFFIALLLGLMRVAFFILIRFSWDSDSGEVENNKLLFYVLDETSTILFFSLSSILIIFWAEIYYISVDDETTFHYVLKPVIFLLNAAAYVAVAICSYLVIDDYTDETDYMFTEYSILIAIVYVAAAVIFGSYAYKTKKELNRIPVQVSTRNERTNILVAISYVFIICLAIRATTVLIFSNRSIDTSNFWVVSVIISYYVLLEYVPVVIAVIFHRVRIVEDDVGCEFDNNTKPWEIMPINGEVHDNHRDDDIERLVQRLSVA